VTYFDQNQGETTLCENVPRFKIFKSIILTCRD